jgi:sarcosine oxidase subunit alpha
VSTQTFRQQAGGEELSFVFDGSRYTGRRGDTLAAALLANGVRRVATSVKLGRPRGIVSAGSEEPSAVVQIEAPFPEPMLTATTVELYDGLVASSLPGQGRLADRPDPARYDARNAHCDVLVVGAGPAGLAAALEAARSGCRVVLADEQSELGGSVLSERADHPLRDWVKAAGAELATLPEVVVLPRTTVFGYFDGDYTMAVERRTNHLGGAAPEDVSRERVWRIRPRRVVLATGAHERSIAFAGNDLPGVMLAASARSYLNRYGVLAGRRAVVFTANDSAYQAAFDLADAGVEVAAVVDVRTEPARAVEDGCRSRGIALLAGHVVTEAVGEDQVRAVRISPAGTTGDSAESTIDADLLLISGGWNPAVHLFSQAGGTLRYDDVLHTFVPQTARQSVDIAGSARGVFSLGSCLSDGAGAGRRAVELVGGTPAATRPLPEIVDEAAAPPAALWFVASPDDDYSRHFVDVQRDVTVDEVRRATGAGLRSVEHVKRYTTAGTAHDQGKTSGVLAAGIVADALGVDVGDLGTTTFRGPYTPVGFATLAGRNRGSMSDPVRVTALHQWHLDHGALFENVGQWKRAWYYPQPGEDLEAAVLRECAAARTGVAFMDGSTLGKIEVQGPDAGAFLDLIYTNMMSTLKVGSIRYGVMCKPDGMVFDDGTAIRLAEDRYLITTTTGNAAAVLEWLEEWLQTEWPELRAYCTSVTEQWATLALVGPKSRAVLAALAPDLAVDNDSFGFMTWRDGVVADLPARVCRISFSGELAYEINVSWWDAPKLWGAVEAAGRDHGITPYGTETMHVLRAEKGYPIIGQDTDGTVTPQDLGMSWVVSKKKPDFIGKRSFARADNNRPDRKHLVGLLPTDRGRLLREGTQVVEHGVLPAPPVPMLGHVTSSYRSAELDRTFALALIKGGRERIGRQLWAVVGDDLVEVTVTGTVFVDPEGTRRDG